jgi:hypothetical protein
MGKAPTKPRSTKKRKHHPPARKKSTAGKVTSAVLAVAGTTGVMTGLHGVSNEPVVVCNGIERWPVKVATDADAKTNKIDLMPVGPLTVPQANAQIEPGPYPVGGRMAVEKKVYTVHGFLSYFKREGGSDGDQDYHVVIADAPGNYTENAFAAPDGHSMVVELPNPKCLTGETGQPANSPLSQAVADARATFEQNVDWPSNKRLTQPIPVTVTGVGFFDFDHHQKGRATPHPGADGKGKVFELHPVTEIVFDNSADPD